MCTLHAHSYWNPLQLNASVIPPPSIMSMSGWVAIVKYRFALIADSLIALLLKDGL